MFIIVSNVHVLSYLPASRSFVDQAPLRHSSGSSILEGNEQFRIAEDGGEGAPGVANGGVGGGVGAAAGFEWSERVEVK